MYLQSVGCTGDVQLVRGLARINYLQQVVVSPVVVRETSRVVKNDFLLGISMVGLQLRWSRQKNPQYIADFGERSTELTPRSQSTPEYACGFFADSASVRQNPQNALHGTIFRTLQARSILEGVDLDCAIMPSPMARGAFD